MKYLRIPILLIIVALAFQSCKKTTQKESNINASWKFSKIEESKDFEGEIHSPDYDDSSWQTVSLPHTANIEPLVVNDQWQGICWYRKKMYIPKEHKNKKMFLEFEAAMNYSKIWINGMEVNEHQGGYLPIVIDISKYIKTGEENLIAVRLDNTDNIVTGPKPLKRLDFNMYGGLYRKASFITKEKIYISHPSIANKVAGGGIFITYPKVSEEKSIVNIKTHLVNEHKKAASVELTQTIYRNEKVVETKTTSNVKIKADGDIELNDQITLTNPALWSPKYPNLYHLVTKVSQDGKVIEEQTTRFGIRAFTFEKNKLYINGKQTFLRGVNRHQEYPFIGYALSDNAQYRDAKKIKDAGFDYIRLSHYPQSPAFMNACDELGIVVIDAIMGWQFYNDTDEFRNYCYNSATQLIRRDRNHPCVMAWEVSLNETKMPVHFMEKLNKIVHAEFPGENVYSCGWMDEVYDIYLQARQHRILRPHPLKDKPLSVSEYGDWEYFSKNAGLNQDKLPNELREELSSRQARGFGEKRMMLQAYNVQEAHNDNFNTPAYSDSYWVMYDYNRGNHDNIEHSGLMDIFRLPKFAYYFYQSQREIDQGAVVKLATYWNEKSSNEIKVYSNCDEVALYLNEALIAKQKPDLGKNTENLKNPPFTFKVERFAPGSLKAIGFVNGEKVSEDIVKTPQKTTNLRVWLDKSGKEATAGQNDVLFLYIAGVDDNDTINPDFEEKINISIDGNAEVVNLDTIQAEAGIATALIKIGNAKGPINISTSSKNFKKDYKFIVH